MKYTAALSVLALAATAVAAPADLEARTNHNNPPPSNCNNNGKQVCCSGLLTCLVQVLGASCNNQAYCCNTEAPVVSHPSLPRNAIAVSPLVIRRGAELTALVQGSLINIALLNCVDIL